MSKGFALPRATSITSQLKDGASASGNSLDTLAARCMHLSSIIKPTYGPLGLKVMSINRLDRIRITGDCTSLFNEIDLNSPDIQIIKGYLSNQFEECGDGCKTTLILANELICEINRLLSQGLVRDEVLNTLIDIEKQLSELTKPLVVDKVSNYDNREFMTRLIECALNSKVIGHSQKLAQLVYDASLPALKQKNSAAFSSENVRICQMPSGGSVSESYVVRGLVLDGRVSGRISKKDSVSRVAVYSCAFDYNQTEASATVQFRDSQALHEFSTGEERLMEELVVSIVESGAEVVVCSAGRANETMLHFANKHGLLVLNVSSKWMIRRLCVALDAKPLVSLVKPDAESLGTCDRVEAFEVNEESFVSFERRDSLISTIVLHGSTKQLVEMAESAVSSGVNLLKVVASRDARLVCGGGGLEMALGEKVRKRGRETAKGSLLAYVYDSFAQCLEKVGENLVENSGSSGIDGVISQVVAMHRKEENCRAGFAIGSDSTIRVCRNATKDDVILDSLHTKVWAIRNAMAAVDQICRVDMIIMAKSSDFNLKPKKDWDNLETDI